MDETQLLLQMVHSAQFWEFKNVRENMRGEDYRTEFSNLY